MPLKTLNAITKIRSTSNKINSATKRIAQSLRLVWLKGDC